MAKECKICTHPEREEIERKLISGMSNRRIATLCDASEASVRRHKANHLPAKLAEAEEAQEVAEANSLLTQARELLDKARSMMDAAEAAGDIRTALVGVQQ